MKEVEKKDAPEVPGGIVDGCIPIPWIEPLPDPQYPTGPIIGPTSPTIEDLVNR